MEELNGAMPSMSRDRENIVSEQEKGNFIEENLLYIGKFLTKVMKVEQRLPVESRNLLTEFRTTWSAFFHPVGTREKMKKKDLMKRRDSDSDDDAVDFGTSINSSSDYADSSGVEDLVLPNETVNRKAEALGIPPVGSNKWLEMLAMLDNRKAPPLEKFDEDSGQQLRVYLRRFEAFCADNFRGSKDWWIGQLEQKLDGTILEAFTSPRDVDDSYDDIKRKLCEWFDDMKCLRKEKDRQNFTKARYRKGEAIHMFSNRLERLYRLAFPRRKVNHSKTLKDKFVNCVPSDFKKVLRTLSMSHTLKGEILTWQLVKKCARHYDVENSKAEVNFDSEPDMVVNVSQNKKRCDASTQVTKEALSLNQLTPIRQALQYVPSQRLRQDTVRREGRNTWYGDARRSGSGSTRAQTRTSAVCHHCGRSGHLRKDCWMRSGRCFKCGSSDHFLRQCPEYRLLRANRMFERREPSQPRERRPENDAMRHPVPSTSNLIPTRQPLNPNALAQRR
jgi:hypothetical protein